MSNTSAGVITNEIDAYLQDPVENDVEPFDILASWSTATKYRVLSTMAKDILAIPVSTVASESAFSTGGRVLDQYRSSLTPILVECLICTQDWLRATPNDSNYEEFVDQLDKCARGKIYFSMFQLFNFSYYFHTNINFFQRKLMSLQRMPLYLLFHQSINLNKVLVIFFTIYIYALSLKFN